MLWIIIGILSIIIIILLIKQNNKVIIDRSEEKQYQFEIKQLKEQKDNLEKDLNTKVNFLKECQQQLIEIQNKYQEEIKKKSSDLDNYFANQKQLRQSEIDIDFERQERERKETLKERVNRFNQQMQEQINKAEIEAKNEIEKWEKTQKDIENVTLFQEERFEALLAPLKQYEMDKQERLYYTIQVPDEYKDDINFLLTTVAAKVQHPDIINKLVWSEYVKPYIDGTFKRANIRDEPGIYKITNINNGKCYIGKSTNIKKRIADHFKSSVGIRAIADQMVHHEILKTGFWNWTIEPIIYCEKDKLNELEKYYIIFFKSQEFGYNKIL